MRIEADALGESPVPRDAYYGIHTQRALENFPVSGHRWRTQFIRAFAVVKHACVQTNNSLGFLPDNVAQAIITACREMETGELDAHILVDPLQGGAGTSTNMNVNEVLANRANEILGGRKGDYHLVNPLAHVNMHQSTNDVFPTALKVAGLGLLRDLENALAQLQAALQSKEQEFAEILKVGRTQMQDAVPMTLGMTFGAFAEALSRDRWRIFKCRERIKQVNLGGTAIGTGLGAPREYILRVVDNLKRLSGVPVSRAENLIDATQNLDCFVEAMGMLNACAANLLKIANDLRLLSSGPDCGLGEVELPPLQVGSSVMAGKINPVMPECVAQIALRVMSANSCVSTCAALGQLELNHLLPLLAYEFIESLVLLHNAAHLFEVKCVRGITARSHRCRDHVEQSKALATTLVPALGYDVVERIAQRARQERKSIKDIVMDMGIADDAALEAILSPQRMRKLGFTTGEYDNLHHPDK